MAFKFAEMIRGFSSGGDKVEAAIALAETLWSAGEAVYDVIVAASSKDADAALERLDAEIERVRPLATGLRAIIKAQQAAAAQELLEKFKQDPPQP